MSSSDHELRVQDIRVESRALGRQVDGFVIVGHGRDVLLGLEERTELKSSELLGLIANRLLVQKGADWTSAIVSEYLGLYDDSLGTFALVWNRKAARLIAHGAVFQSAANPSGALVAHIRTSDEFKGLGLGTLVTETVTDAAFRNGAEYVMLATDDKVNRIEQGERASHSMYARLGYSVVAEKRLADTVDWLMIVNQRSFHDCQNKRAIHDGGLPAAIADQFVLAGIQLANQTRSEYGAVPSDPQIEPVRTGDIAHLFMLLNLCPDLDFRMKLSSWGIQHGPEFERTFITSVRPAMVDKDRLQDASQVLRNERGAILAVCGAQQLLPFTRHTFAIDFYCLPDFLVANPDLVADLVRQTIARIKDSLAIAGPCHLSFWGLDDAKVRLFSALGFNLTGNVAHYYGPHGALACTAKEYANQVR